MSRRRRQPERSAARLNALSSVIEHHRVSGLGEKQPTLDYEAQGRAQNSQTRGEHANDTAEQQRDQAEQEWQPKPGQPNEAAQAYPVLACDTKSHLLEQVVLLGMRRLEQAHLTAAAEQGRGRYRGRGRGCIDRAPISFLEAPRCKDGNHGHDRDAWRARLPQAHEQMKDQQAAHQTECEIVRYDPKVAPLVDWLQG